MLSIIEKGLLTGIGFAAMTKDKVENLAKELIEKGGLSEKEGQALIDDLLKRSEEAQKDLEARVVELVRGAMEKLEVATKKDLAQLEAKIERLGKKPEKDE